MCVFCLKLTSSLTNKKLELRFTSGNFHFCCKLSGGGIPFNFPSLVSARQNIVSFHVKNYMLMYRLQYWIRAYTLTEQVEYIVKHKFQFIFSNSEKWNYRKFLSKVDYFNSSSLSFLELLNKVTANCFYQPICLSVFFCQITIEQ